MKAFVLALLCLLGLAGAAQAQSGASADGSIQIVSPWARATAGSASAGGAFMTIVNKGASADRLIGAASPIAGMAELHETKSENGVMTMSPVPALEIPAGGKAMLAPGGYHVMLMGLKAPLKEGQSFPLTLTFEKAGKIDVEVKIGKPGAMNGDMDGMNMN
jgi:periplasmic copper chaperone A